MFAAENRPSAPSRAAALVVLRPAAALSRAPLGSGAVVQPVLLTIRNWTPTESNIRTHQTHLIRKFKSVWRALTELPDKLIPSWLKIIQQSRRIWRQSLKKKKKHPAETAENRKRNGYEWLRIDTPKDDGQINQLLAFWVKSDSIWGRSSYSSWWVRMSSHKSWWFFSRFSAVATSRAASPEFRFSFTLATQVNWMNNDTITRKVKKTKNNPTLNSSENQSSI